MKDYLICTIFWMLFTILLYMFGRAISKKERNVSFSFVIGYVVYSFLVAIVGIPVQLMNLPWMIFSVYMGILWCAIIVVIIYAAKKKNKKYTFNVRAYIKENYFLYIVCAIVIFMSAFYYAGFWLGNHLDDGYYITKIVTLPYTQMGGNYNYPVGVSNTGFNSYIVNTWEAEASVYVKVLGVIPTLFLRLFQSAFYIFLFANVMKVLAEEVVKTGEFKLSKSIPQYITMIIPLICTYYLYLHRAYILRVRDMFFLQSGMFLGATMVRLCGICLFVIAYLEYGMSKKVVYMIGSYAVIAIVLISKSTIALPIILIITVSSGCIWLICEYGKKGVIITGALGITYFVLGVALPNSENVELAVRNDVVDSLHSIVLYCFTLVFVASFFMKNKLVYKLNIQLILMGLLMIVPEVNDVFELFSVYDFVGGRAWSALNYYFIILNTIYFCWIIYVFIKKNIVVKSTCIVLCVASICSSIYGFHKCGGEIFPSNPEKKADLKKCLKVIRGNKYFIPNSTIFLGEKLEELANETDQKLCVIMPNMVIDNDTLHSLSVFVRAFAPDIISASAIERYNVNDGSELSEYKQVNYDQFVAYPDENTMNALEDELEGTGVNCIVTQSPNYKEWFDQMGYSFYSSTEDGRYYIWYKNNVIENKY